MFENQFSNLWECPSNATWGSLTVKKEAYPSLFRKNKIKMFVGDTKGCQKQFMYCRSIQNEAEEAETRLQINNFINMQHQ